MTVRRCAMPVAMAIGIAAGLGAAPRRADAQQDSVLAEIRAAAATFVPRDTSSVSASDFRDVVQRYTADRDELLHRYDTRYSAERRTALEAFNAAWLARLEAMNFGALNHEGRIDYILLRNLITHERVLADREATQLAEIAPLVPFADTITELEAAHRRMDDVDPEVAGRTLARLAANIGTARAMVAARVDSNRAPSKIDAHHAVEVVTSLRATLKRWFDFYDGYDPLFTWWAAAPYHAADDSLGAYLKLLNEHVIGVKPGEDEPIIGLPIGREAVLRDLAYEMIPYTPEELIAFAEQDLAWSHNEMRKAAREMGYGDDWHAALEKVKEDHVAPGDQPRLIRDLAGEAVQFVRAHDLVTIPPLAEASWRMLMMSPERQKESPFFLGGEDIIVSYPTDAMSEADKLMSMRGNNVHFSRATVFHELVPGHHLQGFMNARYNPQREAFYTPFWIEGNAFYWETLLWDLGFPRSPEDRIGMLFWRMHRAARVIFSLKFHLGQMTPDQAIDFLVDSVGHERANAVAEVRRSFNGDYPPLYQAAYMVGAFQFRALHHELVDSGKMTNREFHDAILHEGVMPVEMVRAALTNQPLTRDYTAHWKFLANQPHTP